MATLTADLTGTGAGVGSVKGEILGTHAGFRGTGAGTGSVGYSVGVPPLAPQNLTPATNSSADLTTQPFTWSYTQPQGLAQAYYAIRFMALGSSTWQWYDATSGTLVSTETKNASSSQTVTPGTALQNGNSYSWQVAVWDSAGVASDYSVSTYVTGSPTPVVTPTAPTGTQTTGSVLLVWTNSNVVQVTTWQVILYTQAQTQASGFSAGSSPWVWSSGLTLGSASSAQLPAVPPGTYYAYIQITSSLGQQSAWTPWEIVYSYTQPAQPTLTATWNEASITVSLQVVGHDTGVLVGETTATVYRSLDSGSTWTAVSSFTNLAVPSSNQTVNGTDYQPVASSSGGSYPATQYYAVIEGPNGTLSARSATASVQPAFPNASGTPSPGWNFLDANTFASNYQPLITSFKQSQPIRGGLHEVLGWAYDVYTVDVVGGRTLELEAVTTAVSDWLSLRTMLETPHVYFVTNIYGLVGLFQVDPKGYNTTQELGSVAATIRHTQFRLVEVGVWSQYGAGT